MQRPKILTLFSEKKKNYFCHTVVYIFKIHLGRNVFSCPTISLFLFKCYKNPAKQKCPKGRFDMLEYL